MSEPVSLIVRHVAPGDSETWLRLRGALWPEGAADDHANEIAKFLGGRAREPVAVLIAEDEAGKALGFAELSIRAYAEGCDSDQVPFLEGWYVIPEARQRGVGRALVAAAEEWARSRGFSEFASDADLANDISAAAHEALGFTEVARVRCFRKDL